MRKLAALVTVVSLGTGCFTTAGLAIGSNKRKHVEVARGEPPQYATYAGEGALIGFLLDTLVASAAVYKLSKSVPEPPPPMPECYVLGCGPTDD